MFLKHLGENCLERHLHPSIYEKMEKTEALLKEGLDKKELEPNGGLDFETYSSLQNRWKQQEQRLMDYKQEVKSTYGSLKNAPSSIGPCEKHKPVIGTKNALVLLTEFNDKKHSHESSEFKKLLFSKDSKSMRNYYLEASWNQLDINGDVNDEWYTLTDNRSEYADDQPINGHYPKAQKLVRETIQNAKNSGKFDFNSYTKDGKIDILIIVYAGSGMDTKLNIKYIRPHQDRLLEPIEVQDGIFADSYCIISELPFDDIGALCHEMGHILGLPDLYKEGYSPVVGSWCLMAIGDHIDDGKTPAHPSAWCKLHLGWTKPKLINQGPQSYEIPAVIDDKSIYKVDVQGSNGREYFLLENRQQKGFDENLPSNGLLIWHVDENACLKRAPNFDPNHFFITLKQSDGKEDLQKNRVELIKKAKFGEEPPKEVCGDLGDPYPGITVNRIFNDESKPNSRTYKGNKSMVEVKSISDSDKLMKAYIGLESQLSNVHIPHSPYKEPSEYLSQDKASIVVNPLLIKYLSSPLKTKDPYERMYEEAKKDFLEEFKENECLNFYQDGYRSGYRQGYDEGIKKLKKLKK